MEDVMVGLVSITFFLSVAGVIILRPITRRLGEYLLESRLDRRGSRLEESELARIRGLLERMNGRLDLLEDRLDFTERLLAPGERRARPRGVHALSDEE
jgi:hypothetical protein